MRRFISLLFIIRLPDSTMARQGPAAQVGRGLEAAFFRGVLLVVTGMPNDIASLPEPLPIEAYLPAIANAIRDGGALVLSASPGAGKTSLVPPAIAEALEASGCPARKVLVMEPRRIAAVAAAARIAELWGRKLGAEVGYRVRGESRTSAGALVEAVTPGVLIRMLQGDPSLEGVGCVILDEFHERSAQADLALAFLAESRELRREEGPELRFLAMSATIRRGRVRIGLGCRLIEAPGRSFPIDTRNFGSTDGFGAAAARGPAFRLEAAIARSALALMEEAGGDVLAFLPGVAEITRAAAEFTTPSADRAARRRPSPGLRPPRLPGPRRTAPTPLAAERRPPARRLRDLYRRDEPHGPEGQGRPRFGPREALALPTSRGLEPPRHRARGPRQGRPEKGPRRTPRTGNLPALLARLRITGAAHRARAFPRRAFGPGPRGGPLGIAGAARPALARSPSGRRMEGRHRPSHRARSPGRRLLAYALRPAHGRPRAPSLGSPPWCSTASRRARPGRLA